MADKLSLYNEALRVLAARRLRRLTDDVKTRYTLDAIYDEGGESAGVVVRCLSEGLWNFAMRTVRLDYDSTIEPTFGFRRGFTIPDDYVRLAQISADEYFSVPERQYVTERGVWYCDHDVIYVRYVSKSTDYGLNLGAFPPNFTRFVACYIAAEAAPTIAKEQTEIAEAKLKRARTRARSNDAMEDPSKQPSETSWVAARRSGGHRQDSGSRNNLIG